MPNSSFHPYIALCLAETRWRQRHTLLKLFPRPCLADLFVSPVWFVQYYTEAKLGLILRTAEVERGGGEYQTSAFKFDR